MGDERCEGGDFDIGVWSPGNVGVFPYSSNMEEDK
jgi:hypothetical protein